MNATRFLVVLTTIITTVVFSQTALAFDPTAANHGGNAQNTTRLDLADGSVGGWSNTTATVANRPYIAYLGITNPGFPEIVVIDNVAAAAARPNVQQIGGGQYSDVYAFVAPTNACNTSQTPAPGVCYANPNRVTVYLGAETSANSWTENMTSTNTVPNVTENSEIHLIIGFKAAYSSLRWSWVDGVPSYWKNNVVPGIGGTVEVKFTPKTMPVMNSGGCSQIPVSTCELTQADSERLQPQIILSMDDTLDVGLTGVLFGSTNAFIGSLESSPIVAGQAPTLTYGVAAPHLMSVAAGGAERRGTFYALIPSNILTLFGTSVGAFDSSILSVDRTGSAGSFTLGWSAWNATANGTDGQLLTISDISFSAPKFQVARRGGSSGSSTSSTGTKGSGNGNKVKLGSTTSFKALLSALNLRAAAGSKTTGRTTTPKVCTATKTGIKAIATGTCKGTITVTPKKGKPTKKNFTLVVTKTGKRLPVTFHR